MKAIKKIFKKFAKYERNIGLLAIIEILIIEIIMFFWDPEIEYIVFGIVGILISILLILKNKKVKVIYFLVILCFIGVFIMYVYSSAQAQVVNSLTSKPIIYLYPEEETNIKISLGNPKMLTCTYPKYKEDIGWNVIAMPNGELTYMEDGGKLYALYWEGKSVNNKKIEDDGFVIKGEDTAIFLEEKLAILGLTEREAEEFIIYWLPRMEKNKFNYIRFETKEEIDNNMPLNIEPNPGTTIRVVMDWCGIDNENDAQNTKNKIKEQILYTPERNGFVAVEWGGSEI